MEHCISCNEKIGNDKFCSYCGESQICETCGERYHNLSAFCSNCGAERSGKKSEAEQASTTTAIDKTEQTAARQEQPVQQPRKNFLENIGKRNLFIIGGIIAAALIAFFIFQGSEDDPEKVVEGFIQAFNDRDAAKIVGYMDPRQKREIMEMEGLTEMEMEEMLQLQFDYFDIAEAVKVELLELIPEDFGENYIEYEMTVMVTETTRDEGTSSETETETIKLTKYDEQWYIEDIY